jgi:hypothetical protein
MTITHFPTAVLSILLPAVALADGAPKIQFDKLVYDFGRTTLVESVTGTFTYHNAGTGVLEIQKPRPSCGCTVAKLNPDKLQPGEKGELVFTIALGNAAIELEKEIYVPSNDPVTPTVRLVTKVSNKIIIQTQPPAVAFGELPLGATTNRTILVKRTDGKNLTITKAECALDAIRAEVVPSPDLPPSEARLRISITATGLPRYVSEQVRIHTDDSVGAARAIFVNARFLGDLKLEPETLVWGMPDPTRNPDIDVILSRSFTVTATKPGPLVIRNLSCTIKDVKLRLTTLESKRSYQIEATFARRIKESVRGTIRFETNLPTMPAVEVPIEVNLWKE